MVARQVRGAGSNPSRRRLVPLPVGAAESAGLVLGQIRSRRERATLAIDVLVMAFAAIYGGALVYTSVLDDLERLGAHYPSVRLLRI